MRNFRVYNGYANTPQDDAGYGLCVQEGTEIVIGLNENVELGGMRIIPNPNDGDFSIRMPEASGPGHLEVIDGTGRTVLRDRIPASNGGLFHVRAAEELAPGLYVVNVKCGEEVRTQRLVVR
ncbi:MAG: T9SS type A sorting domain-containing protein [Flavobacteriales bacterium]|nr:T9SS type A sorting domain-containing protein [Flavobacteriales bacterium]